ncbi:MAG: TonB-dependent receptor [Pseudomonadota bacterium]
MSTHQRSGLIAAVAASLTCANAEGQEQPQPEPLPAGDVVVLDELFVTARRTEELLQDVPGSVVVLSDEELERSNLQTTSEIINRLPNVNFTGGGGPNDLFLSIRGVSNLIATGATGPTNGVFVDGVLINPTGGISGINSTAVDLERVETAFGPQGTNFGRGTIGGAINFVTKKPTDVFEASLSLEAASFPDGRGTAIVNLPLLEDGLLSARLVAFGGVSDGFVDYLASSDPDTIGTDNAGFRLSLGSRPTDRLSLNASFSFDRTGFDDTNSATLESVEDEDPVFAGMFVEENKLQRILLSGEAVYDLDVGSFILRSSYYETDEATFTDSDLGEPNFTLGIVDLEEQAISEELRFESEEFDLPRSLGTLSFNVGAAISFTDFSLESTTDPEDDAFAFIGDALFGSPLGDDGSTFVILSEQELFNFGIFGDVRWRPIPDLELAAGARFHLDRVSESGETLSGGLTAALLPPVELQTGRETFTAITPNASVKYDWSDDLSTYLSFSTGFRAGGFITDVTGFQSFDEESVRQIEGGFRARFLDGRLAVTGSGYFLDYEDIQVSTIDTIGTTVFTTIDNAASARSVGAEVSIAAAPIEGLTLNALMGVNFSKFTDFTDSSFGDLTGTRLPNAPVHTLSITADYQHPEELLPGIDGFVRAEYNFRTGFTSLLDPDVTSFDGYDVLNFRLGLRSERFEIEAFVENALNEVYATDVVGTPISFVPSPTTVDIGPTRRFGVRGRMTF